jgi:uncharacterized membrane protein YphA (DoxX/SURF4 family)
MAEYIKKLFNYENNSKLTAFYSIFRILVALMFIEHGAQKIFGAFGGVDGTGGTVAIVSLFGLAGIIVFWRHSYCPGAIY